MSGGLSSLNGDVCCWVVKSHQMMIKSVRFVQFFVCHEGHLSYMISVDCMVNFFLRGAASSLKVKRVALCMLSISVTPIVVESR